MGVVEGRALLARLQDWAVQPDFTYQHQWQEGDLVIWDNIGVLHRVVAYDAASGRRMNRTSVAPPGAKVAAYRKRRADRPRVTRGKRGET
jgi:alpha-ketoglutarate-dependent taurine dioxygenase